MYVHEYLVHIGAQKTANSFLQEVRLRFVILRGDQIRWDKSISVGEPPGFLHSWWRCVGSYNFIPVVFFGICIVLLQRGVIHMNTQPRQRRFTIMYVF